MFTRARAAAPCILFFDEIDAIAAKRTFDFGGGAGPGRRARESHEGESEGERKSGSKSKKGKGKKDRGSKSGGAATSGGGASAGGGEAFTFKAPEAGAVFDFEASTGEGTGKGAALEKKRGALGEQ